MTYQDRDEKRRGNRPVEVLRDGALKVSIFRNLGEEGSFYSLVPGRVYTDKDTGQVQETTSFNANEALRVAHLMTKGHEQVRHRREQDKKQEQEKEKPAAERSAGRRAGRSHQEHFNRENGFPPGYDRER